jgi:hypothetical protein
MRLNVCGLYENPASGGRHGRGLIRRKHRQRRKNHVSAACGSDDVMFSVKSSATQQPAPQPEHGRALVYVLEQWETKWDNELPPTGFLQGKPTVRVALDGSWVGANRGASYFFFPVEPGEHHLCADWQSAPPSVVGRKLALSNLRAEPGQTYYLRARFVEGARIYQHPQTNSETVLSLCLEQINPDQGRAAR